MHCITYYYPSVSFIWRTLKKGILTWQLFFTCRLHMVFSSPRHLMVAGGSIIALEILYKMDFSLIGFIICCSILGFGMIKLSTILFITNRICTGKQMKLGITVSFHSPIFIVLQLDWQIIPNANVCRDTWSNFFRPQQKRFFSQFWYIKWIIGWPRSDSITSNLMYVHTTLTYICFNIILAVC